MRSIRPSASRRPSPSPPVNTPQRPLERANPPGNDKAAACRRTREATATRRSRARPTGSGGAGSDADPPGNEKAAASRKLTVKFSEKKHASGPAPSHMPCLGPSLCPSLPRRCQPRPRPRTGPRPRPRPRSRPLPAQGRGPLTSTSLARLQAAVGAGVDMRLGQGPGRRKRVPAGTSPWLTLAGPARRADHRQRGSRSRPRDQLVAAA